MLSWTGDPRFYRPAFAPSRCRQIERRTAPWPPLFSAVLLLFGYLIFEAVTRLWR